MAGAYNKTIVKSVNGINFTSVLLENHIETPFDEVCQFFSFEQVL